MKSDKNEAAYPAVIWQPPVAILGSPAFLPEVLTPCQTNKEEKNGYI